VRRLFYGFRYRSEVNLPDFNPVQTYVWVSAIEIMDSVGYDPAHRLR
jgi:hypothetical protein